MPTKLLTRKIDLAFTLGTGAFGEGTADTVNISGLRTSVSIVEAGGSTAQLQLRVWGMPIDTMRRLTVLNLISYGQARQNTVTVKAGDSDSGTSVVFVGTISEAWADASNPPDVQFVVAANAGLLAAVKPIPPTSFKGPVAADVFFASMARQIDDNGTPRSFRLENSGVTAVLDNPYFPGTALAQIKAAAAAVRCNYFLDMVRGVLAIWPKNQARGEGIVQVSPTTGLVGYPQFTQNGIAFTTLYSPTLTYGQRVKVTSTLQASEIGQALGNADGVWQVAAVQHNLEAELPGGQWFTRVECGLVGGPAPIIGTPS